MSVNIHQTTERCIPEDRNFNTYSTLYWNYCVNFYLKSLLFIIQHGSKLFSGFPFIGHGNPDSNLESSCTRNFRIPQLLKISKLFPYYYDTFIENHLIHVPMNLARFSWSIKYIYFLCRNSIVCIHNCMPCNSKKVLRVKIICLL
jgi:hypothetical protein